jgi:hypothetical protein
MQWTTRASGTSQQRLDIGQVGRRLLAHDGLATTLGIDAQEGREGAPLRAIGGQQAGFHVGARDLARQPAPVGAQLAQS